MRSLRAYAACIGIDSGFSVLRDFFGYSSAPPWPQGTPREPVVPAFMKGGLSLHLQMERLDVQYFNLAVIRVGVGSGYWDDDKTRRVDCALQLAREIYARAGFGVGRVIRFDAPDSAPFQVTNFNVEDILGSSSGDNLVENYTVDRNVLNAFFAPVLNNDAAGFTPHGRAGFIVGMEGPPIDDSGFSVPQAGLSLGRTLAHEIGHVLIDTIDTAFYTILIELAASGNAIPPGFSRVFSDPGDWDHHDDPSNLMIEGPDALRDAHNQADVQRSVGLDSRQRRNIRRSKWMKAPCFQIPPLEEEIQPFPENVHRDG